MIATTHYHLHSQNPGFPHHSVLQYQGTRKNHIFSFQSSVIFPVVFLLLHFKTPWLHHTLLPSFICRQRIIPTNKLQKSTLPSRRFNEHAFRFLQISTKQFYNANLCSLQLTLAANPAHHNTVRSTRGIPLIHLLIYAITTKYYHRMTNPHHSANHPPWWIQATNKDAIPTTIGTNLSHLHLHTLKFHHCDHHSPPKHSIFTLYRIHSLTGKEFLQHNTKEPDCHRCKFFVPFCFQDHLVLLHLPTGR